MSLSPTSTQYLVGTPKSLKSQNFDEIFGVLDRFVRRRVLCRT